MQDAFHKAMSTSAVSDGDLRSMQEARELAARAREAQERFAAFDAAAVDRICEAIAQASDRGAEALAQIAYQETRCGVYEHKVFKNRYCGAVIWPEIRRSRTIGPIDYDAKRGIVTLAEPMGVIAALVPMTHPTATVVFNALIALKGRNAVVFAPHPRSRRSSLAASRLVAAAAEAAGAPPGIITCMEHVSLAGTTELMQQGAVRLILATGGAAMVRAVYSSGKPTIAAGPGNVPCYVDRTAQDLRTIAQGIVASKCFDNGTPCASEQAIIVDAPVAERLAAELVRSGCRFLDPQEKAALGKRLVMPDGSMNPEVVGQGASRLAEIGGFSVEQGTRVLLAPAREVGKSEPYSAEILSCVAAFYVVDGWRQGLERCNEILRYGGMGHTVGVYATTQEALTAFSLCSLAFRVVVNGPTNFGVLGATTNLPPTLMFGGGTWGGGITSDNLGPQHLINRRRVAWTLRDVPAEFLGAGTAEASCG